MSLNFTKPSNAEIRALISSGLEGVEGVSNTIVKNIATSILNDLETRVNGYMTDAKKVIDALQQEVDDVMATHNGAYEKDEETFKAKYEATTAELTTANTAKTAAEKALADRNTEIENEKTYAAIDTALTNHLTAIGLRPDLIAGEVERASLKGREGLTLELGSDKKPTGKLKDADKITADVQGRLPKDFFAEEKPGGAGTFAGNAFAGKVQTGTNITGSTPNATVNAAIRGAAGGSTDND